MIRPRQISRQHRCVIPGCNKPEDRRYAAYYYLKPGVMQGYFCTHHGARISLSDEHSKVLPMEAFA